MDTDNLIVIGENCHNNPTFVFIFQVRWVGCVLVASLGGGGLMITSSFQASLVAPCSASGSGRSQLMKQAMAVWFDLPVPDGVETIKSKAPTVGGEKSLFGDESQAPLFKGH